MNSGLRAIALHFSEPAKSGEGARVVRVDRERFDQARRGELRVVLLFEQASQLDLRIGQLRAAGRPALEQAERGVGAASLDKQHRQPAVTLRVIRVVLQTLIVVAFSLGEVVGVIRQLARFVERGSQVVVAGGRFGVVRDGALKRVGGLLIVLAGLPSMQEAFVQLMRESLSFAGNLMGGN